MFNNDAMQVAATALAADITHVSVHTAGAVSSSGDESAAAREPITWVVSAGGDLSIDDPILFSGGDPDGPAVRIGYWTADSGGSYRGGFLLDGDQAFNSAGAYRLTGILEDSLTS